jgi:hypothetical protein
VISGRRRPSLAGPPKPARSGLIEPYRPQVDQKVLEFIRTETFTPRDFAIDAQGVCRLHPDLARRIAHGAALVAQPTKPTQLLTVSCTSCHPPDEAEVFRMPD